MRKHRERVARHPLPCSTSGASHKVRHGTELALRNELERLARLERECVARDVHFDGRVLTRPDVEACLRGGARDFGKWGGSCGGGWGRGLVDEHGGREAGQAAVVEVCGAPVVAVTVAVAVRGFKGFEVAV